MLVQWHSQRPADLTVKVEPVELNAQYKDASDALKKRLEEFGSHLKGREHLLPLTLTEMTHRYMDDNNMQRPPNNLSRTQLFIRVATIGELRSQMHSNWQWDKIKIEGPLIDCKGRSREHWYRQFNCPPDPIHNWGIDKFGRYACCGQPQTHPGCWMGEEKNKLVPYDIAPQFGEKVWQLVRDESWEKVGKLWLNEPQKGTKWLYFDIYENWHKEIVELKFNLKDAIVNAIKKDYEEFRSDKRFVFDPFKQLEPLTKLLLDKLIALQEKYNRIQCTSKDKYDLFKAKNAKRILLKSFSDKQISDLIKFFKDPNDDDDAEKLLNKISDLTKILPGLQNIISKKESVLNLLKRVSEEPDDKYIEYIEILEPDQEWIYKGIVKQFEQDIRSKLFLDTIPDTYDEEIEIVQKIMNELSNEKLTLMNTYKEKLEQWKEIEDKLKPLRQKYGKFPQFKMFEDFLKKEKGDASFRQIWNSALRNSGEDFSYTFSTDKKLKNNVDKLLGFGNEYKADKEFTIFIGNPNLENSDAVIQFHLNLLLYSDINRYGKTEKEKKSFKSALDKLKEEYEKFKNQIKGKLRDIFKKELTIKNFEKKTWMQLEYLLESAKYNTFDILNLYNFRQDKTFNTIDESLKSLIELFLEDFSATTLDQIKNHRDYKEVKKFNLEITPDQIIMNKKKNTYENVINFLKDSNDVDAEEMLNNILDLKEILPGLQNIISKKESVLNLLKRVSEEPDDKYIEYIKLLEPDQEWIYKGIVKQKNQDIESKLFPAEIPDTYVEEIEITNNIANWAYQAELSDLYKIMKTYIFFLEIYKELEDDIVELKSKYEKFSNFQPLNEFLKKEKGDAEFRQIWNTALRSGTKKISYTFINYWKERNIRKTFKSIEEKPNEIWKNDDELKKFIGKPGIEKSDAVIQRTVNYYFIHEPSSTEDFRKYLNKLEKDYDAQIKDFKNMFGELINMKNLEKMTWTERESYIERAKNQKGDIFNLFEFKKTDKFKNSSQELKEKIESFLKDFNESTLTEIKKILGNNFESLMKPLITFLHEGNDEKAEELINNIGNWDRILPGLRKIIAKRPTIVNLFTEISKTQNDKFISWVELLKPEPTWIYKKIRI